MALHNKPSNKRGGFVPASGSPMGSHAKKGPLHRKDHAAGTQREQPYYARNRSLMGQIQGKQVHRMASKRFSQYDTSAIRPKKGPGGKIAAVIIVIAVLVALFFIADSIFHFTGQGTASKSDVVAGQEVEVVIEPGSSTTAIAKTLYDHDVIADEKAFIDAVNSQNADTSLKPGTYRLTTLMDTDELVRTLAAGPAFYGSRLTVPEGSTINETADFVQKATGIAAADFLQLAQSAETYAADYPFVAGAYGNSLEGYLFPKTYDVPNGATADDVIRMMLDQFVQECADLGITDQGANGHALSEIVNVAAMIERESQDPDEGPLIASVIYNRLAQGMPLQIDATVVYALGDAYTGGTVTYDDLEVDSPYNTYLNPGLPVGPICSPGAQTLRAAANPASTDYLYYLVTDDQGHHSFFEDYDGFLAAKGA